MGTQFFLTEDSEKLLLDLTPNSLRVKFLEIFSYAIKGGLEERGKDYVHEVALLFDQLIDLVAAASTLHQVGGARAVSNSNDLLTGQKGTGHE